MTKRINMNLRTPEAKEAIDRVDTIHWSTHMAILSYTRYKEILSNKKLFETVFPGISFDNPKITHTVGEQGVLFTTSKREIIEEHNYNLFKAWQIVLAIIAMTSILEHYLKTVAEKVLNKTIESMGIFYRFKDETNIHITEFTAYSQLRHFYEVRNISMHNLGRINPRFKNKTAEQHHKEGPYIFYPQQITEYRNIIESFLFFIESKIVKNV